MSAVPDTPEAHAEFAFSPAVPTNLPSKVLVQLALLTQSSTLPSTDAHAPQDITWILTEFARSSF